ncbi:MAG: hypothetical protein ACYTEQ_21665 [Planctomycetota bacterium]|jgi:hypothetical protein
MGIGGAIVEVSVDGRAFTVAADNDASRKLGGSENELGFNGDGTARILKTVVGWALGGLQLACDDANQDQEYLQEKANLSRLYPITVTFASGLTYGGSGQILGELTFANQSTTNSLGFGGSGKFTQQ